MTTVKRVAWSVVPAVLGGVCVATALVTSEPPWYFVGLVLAGAAIVTVTWSLRRSRWFVLAAIVPGVSVAVIVPWQTVDRLADRDGWRVDVHTRELLVRGDQVITDEGVIVDKSRQRRFEPGETVSGAVSVGAELFYELSLEHGRLRALDGKAKTLWTIEVEHDHDNEPDVLAESAGITVIYSCADGSGKASCGYRGIKRDGTVAWTRTDLISLDQGIAWVVGYAEHQIGRHFGERFIERPYIPQAPVGIPRDSPRTNVVLDPATGETVYASKERAGVVGDMVVFAAADGQDCRFKAVRDGKVTWTSRVPISCDVDPIRVLPTFGRVYVNLGDQWISLEPDDGAWGHGDGDIGHVEADLPVGGADVVVDDAEDDPGTLVGHDPRTGKELWRQSFFVDPDRESLDVEVYTGGVQVQSYVESLNPFFEDDDVQITRLDPRSGRITDSVVTRPGAESVILDDGRLCVEQDGTIVFPDR